jgi:xanthine dehydrogenase YagS FAD-binding subunit
VTLSRLAAAPSISGSPELAALYGAILNSASPQLRHMATIGGNLLQKPRCWYYRNKLTHCWRKGGRMCYAYRGQNKYHVILNGGPCYAVHPSDPAVALLALDAGVTLVGPQGTRSLTLDEFFHKPGRESRNATTLGADELITEISVPAPAEGSRSAYVKVAERAAWDFALGSAAARLTMADDVVQEARLCLGGVANVPWRAEAAEDVLAGGELSDEAIERAATAATTEAKPLEHNAYKVDLIQGAIREVLRRLRDQ